MSGGGLDVAIHLSATNGVSGVLAAISKEMFGLQAGVGKLEEGFKNLKPIIVGAVAALAGMEGLKLLGHLEEAGEKLVHNRVMLDAALPAQNKLVDGAKAYGAAIKEAGDNMRTTITGNVDALHDLYTVTQSMDHAVDLLPSFNMLKNTYDGVNDKEGGGAETKNVDVINMLKGFEIAGRNTTDALKKIVPLADQMVIGLKGRVTGSDVRQQIQATGIARYGYSDEFLSQRLPIMVATGLRNAGVALYQFRRMMVQGVVSEAKIMPAAEIKYGLHTASDEQKDSKGKILGFKPGSLWENDVAKSNPTRWGQDYREHLKSMGYDITNANEVDKIVSEIAARNKNLASILAEILMPQAAAQQEKEFKNIQGVSKTAQGDIDKNDPKAWRQALSAKTEDLKDVLGQALVQPFIDNVLKPLTKGMRDLSQLAAAHPDAVSNIMKGLAVLAGGITVFGVALAGAGIVAAIGLIGPIGLGIGAVAAAIAVLGAGLAAFKPDLLKSLGKQMVDGFKTAFDGFKTLDPGKIVSGIAAIFNADMLGLPGLVGGSIKAAIAGIGSAILSGITGLASGGGKVGTGTLQQVPLHSIPNQQHSSYAPPNTGSHSKVAGNVYLDGDKVGTVLDRRTAMNNRAVNSAAGHDGRADWTHPEYSYG